MKVFKLLLHSIKNLAGNTDFIIKHDGQINHKEFFRSYEHQEAQGHHQHSCHKAADGDMMFAVFFGGGQQFIE